MIYLLDTNVVSELRTAASGRSDKNVVAWAESVSSLAMYLSVISIQELEIGVLQMERRDERQGRVLREWLETRVLPAFTDRILPIDLSIIRESAPLHVPDIRPVRDALIAATARIHGMTVVTRNARDFEPMAVACFNPWDFVDG